MLLKNFSKFSNFSNFMLQTKVLETTSATSSFWTHANQQTDFIYLDAGKSYYYRAYFASKHHGADYALGLFGKKTSKPQSKYPDIARDERQKVIVKTTDTPLAQVGCSLIFSLLCLLNFKLQKQLKILLPFHQQCSWKNMLQILEF